MISARKVRANRANARASTGPRTAAGKANAAGNARRHGLNLSVLADPALATEVESLAREIMGEGADRELQEFASRIAEAQIDLVRVRWVRHNLLSRALADPDYDSPSPTPPIPPESLAKPPEGVDKLATIFADLAEWLMLMDRYERRSLSRRKFAIRAFDAARSARVSNKKNKNL